ncbi:signal peptidase I [Dyadobacter sp. LHD-138]|uniref:signal peptidase I n=1 Tax=Dyadobacter sp. LHD-138 TaxID=3071413 RepID=UPI0027E12989|nr:signal peptidase I [Dyadobacter sp. LHD-138]MDQ6479945.1 signal peptidase I [Dyadobacter sp. LHD-138]
MITPVHKEAPRTPVKTKKKSAVREWLDSVLFAVIAATLIRWLFFEAFVIPSSSMEHTLLVGEYLFVSKLHYGTRTPITPLQVPLSHQTLWGTEIPSYMDLISLPKFRLPGFSDVKRGDVVVFNIPSEHPGLYQKYSHVLPNLKPHPIDLRTNYIKRCVAQPGDQFELKDGQVYVNGAKSENPEGLQSDYFVSSGTAINETNIFKKNGITEYSPYTETFDDSLSANDEQGYIVKTTAETAEKLKSYDFVKRVQMTVLPKGMKETYLYPNSERFGWNKDNYGPIVIPKEGVNVRLTDDNIALYGEIIQYFDGNDDIIVKDRKVTKSGKVIDNYTFRQDYYFMMGDNRHNSADSRYWGFVPKDHIVGKAVFVWMSIDPDPLDFVNKIRWNRLFRIIE